MEGAAPMDTISKVDQKRGIRMGRSKLFAWLRTQGYFMKNNESYQTNKKEKNDDISNA
jgi:phage antirepressor YoqD-like protein